jgi:WD40 repeat protein
VTCGRDGCVRVWDPRVPEPVLSLEPKDGESARDCWTVAFGDSFDDDHRAICAGYDNGDVKLFDLRTSAVRWETNVGNGVVSLEFDRKDIEMNKVWGGGGAGAGAGVGSTRNREGVRRLVPQPVLCLQQELQL